KPDLLQPLGRGTTVSTAHAMLAISSRMRTISSTGLLSCIFATVGNSNRSVSAAEGVALSTFTENIFHRVQSLAAPLPAASIQKISPNEFVNDKPLILV